MIALLALGSSQEGLSAERVSAQADRPGRPEELPALVDVPEADPPTPPVAEFVLESLHVHNKLNKNEKAGRTTYRK